MGFPQGASPLCRLSAAICACGTYPFLPSFVLSPTLCGPFLTAKGVLWPQYAGKFPRKSPIFLVFLFLFPTPVFSCSPPLFPLPIIIIPTFRCYFLLLLLILCAVEEIKRAVVK